MDDAAVRVMLIIFRSLSVSGEEGSVVEGKTPIGGHYVFSAWELAFIEITMRGDDDLGDGGDVAYVRRVINGRTEVDAGPRVVGSKLLIPLLLSSMRFGAPDCDLAAEGAEEGHVGGFAAEDLKWRQATSGN